MPIFNTAGHTLPPPRPRSQPAGPGGNATRLRVSHGYSIGYLPLMVMRNQNLIEKHAAQIGAGQT